MYLLFAVPTLALFWLGVDFGVGDIDTQDLVVKVVLFVLFFSIIRRIYLDFLKVTKKKPDCWSCAFFSITLRIKDFLMVVILWVSKVRLPPVWM